MTTLLNKSYIKNLIPFIWLHNHRLLAYQTTKQVHAPIICFPWSKDHNILYKQVISKLGRGKKRVFYPPFVDKRFTPPPLFTLADLIIILSKFKYYPHQLTSPLPPLSSISNLYNTKRYSPLRGPTSSSCGGLQPSAKAFFCPSGKKTIYNALWLTLGSFGVQK